MNVLVIAPHADDETLGCGGTILKHKAVGDRITWLLATGEMVDTWIEQRKAVQIAYGITCVCSGFAPAEMDKYPLGLVVQAFALTFKEFQPDVVYCTHPGDVHSDHRVVFDAAWAAAKPLRGPGPSRFLTYETPSSTNLAAPGRSLPFQPNVYVDIIDYLKKKLEILELYRTELSPFPAPRSILAVKSLAYWRGASIHVDAAEAFMLMREVR